jgi:hypothetical protein
LPTLSAPAKHKEAWKPPGSTWDERSKWISQLK